ncbi:hypothetical protein AO057_11735 [Curvibacter sp. PAE-UM]|nr:hypothetical protein AO057_11735 [Curvibacter sp. PAE-UM]
MIQSDPISTDSFQTNMGLKADIDEAVQHWDRSPWRIKVFLVIALFLTTTSLASLSEAVFKWKGFILDALTFYQTWISHPLVELIQGLVGRPLPPNFVDNAIVMGLFFGGLIRGHLLRNLPRVRLVAEVAFFIGAYALMLYAFAIDRPAQREMSSWFFYPIFLLVAYGLSKGAERILALSYMLIPVFGIAVIAAISAGLSK